MDNILRGNGSESDDDYKSDFEDYEWDLNKKVADGTPDSINKFIDKFKNKNNKILFKYYNVESSFTVTNNGTFMELLWEVDKDFPIIGLTLILDIPIKESSIFNIKDNREYFKTNTLKVDNKEFKNLDFAMSIMLAILCSLGITKSTITDISAFDYSLCINKINKLLKNILIGDDEKKVELSIDEKLSEINTFILNLLIGKDSIYEKYGYTVLKKKNLIKRKIF